MNSSFLLSWLPSCQMVKNSSYLTASFLFFFLRFIEISVNVNPLLFIYENCQQNEYLCIRHGFCSIGVNEVKRTPSRNSQIRQKWRYDQKIYKRFSHTSVFRKGKPVDPTVRYNKEPEISLISKEYLSIRLKLQFNIDGDKFGLTAGPQEIQPDGSFYFSDYYDYKYCKSSFHQISVFIENPFTILYIHCTSCIGLRLNFLNTIYIMFSSLGIVNQIRKRIE